MNVSSHTVIISWYFYVVKHVKLSKLEIAKAFSIFLGMLGHGTLVMSTDLHEQHYKQFVGKSTFGKKYHEMFLEQFPLEKQGAKPDRLLPLTQQGGSSSSFKTGLLGAVWLYLRSTELLAKIYLLNKSRSWLIIIRIHENQLPVPTCQSSLLLGSVRNKFSKQNFCL